MSVAHMHIRVMELVGFIPIKLWFYALKTSIVLHGQVNFYCFFFLFNYEISRLLNFTVFKSLNFQT